MARTGAHDFGKGGVEGRGGGGVEGSSRDARASEGRTGDLAGRAGAKEAEGRHGVV